jgi:beta-lactamase regulating signal transducer with metallopeptidase domain
VSAIPSLAWWLDTLLVLLAGGAALVGPAALLGRWLRSGVGRRTLWQAATVALAVLLVTEGTGVGAGLSAWLRERPAAPETVGAVPTAVPAPNASALAGEPEADPLAAPAPRGPEAGPAPRAAPASAVWWPGALWLAGASLVAGRVALARGLLLVFRGRHRPVTDDRVRECVGRVAARLGLRRRVLVLEADGLLGPVAFGTLRPTVALPGRFASTFAPPQQEVILAHELTHLAAGDPAWHLLADLVTAVLWWHPMAWWARHQLRTASELAADEGSLAVADGPAVLARCLVELGGVLAGARSAGWVRMAGNGFRSGLGRRVERLVRLEGRPWRPPGRARSWLTLALAAAALVAVAGPVTAWARARAFPEGDVPMRHAWQRSLAAVVLVTALGSDTDPARAGDPPAAPPTNDQQTIGLEKVPGPDAPADQRQLQMDQEDVRRALKDLADQQDKVLRAKKNLAQAAGGGPPEADLKKLTEQLERLKALAAELERKKADLEANLQALEQKRSEAATHIKVFRLHHRDPGEIQSVLQTLLAHQASEAEGVGAGDKTSPMMGAMMMGGRGGRGGRPGMGGPMPGMMGGGMGGPAPTWRLAADRRTHCLIVRGTDRDIRTVADLLAMLDVEDGKPVPRVKNYRVFRLRYAGANEVAMIVQRLDIDALIVPAPKAQMVIVSGPEAALKEIGEVIDAVDVEGKATSEKGKNIFGEP